MEMTMRKRSRQKDKRHESAGWLFSNRDLLKLFWPLIIEQILVMIVGVADTMMVSQAGEAAVSGVGLVDMVANLIITVFGALATGGAVIVSQYLGNRDTASSRRAAGQVSLLTLLVSLVITVICVFGCQGILNLFFGSVALDVMQACYTYFFISAFSFPFLAIYSSAGALFRSAKMTKITMYVSLLMNGINIVGNFIGVFILHLGVAGVAIPTLLSRIVAGLLLFALLFRSKYQIGLQWKDMLGWDGSMMKRILGIALPNGIENGLFSLGRVLVTSIVALFGTAQIAANSVAGSIDQIALVIIQAINLGIVTVVGQCVGADDYRQARYYIRKLMKAAYIVNGIGGGLVILALPVLLNLYSLSPEARAWTMLLVIMHNVLCTLLHPTSFVLPNGMRAAGDAKYSMIVGIASMLVFRLGTAVVFGIWLHMGILGVWIAMGADWACRSLFFWLRFKSGRWEEFRAI